MSKNLYTEYVFTKHDYEQALIELHAILYNIALRNQALLRSISSYDFSENSEAIRNEASMLYKQATACVEKILNMGYDLSERLKQADSYQAVFADLKTKSMQELISTMRTKYNYAIVDEAATPYVPEQDITSKNEMNNNISEDVMNNNNSDEIVEEEVKQPTWTDPKTGAVYWVDPSNDMPYYVDPETGISVYVDKNDPEGSIARNLGIVTGAVQPEETLASEEPIVTDTKVVEDDSALTETGETNNSEVEEGPVITKNSEEIKTAEEKIEEEPVITSSTTIVEDTTPDDKEESKVDEASSEAKEEAKTEEVTTSSNNEKVDESDIANGTAENSEEEPVMDYNNEISRIKDETGEAPSEEVKAEDEPVMDYNNEISKIKDETGEASSVEEAKAEEEPVMDYNNDISKIKDETGEVSSVEEAKTEDQASSEAVVSEDAEEKMKKIEAVMPTVELSSTSTDAVDSEVAKEEKPAIKDDTTSDSTESEDKKAEAELPVEVSADGTSDTIEVPEVSDSSIIDATSAPLIPVEDISLSIGDSNVVEENNDNPVDLNSIVPTIPDPIGLTSEADTQLEVAKEEEPTMVDTDTSTSSNILVFEKRDDSQPAKAILVSKHQASKLRGSRGTQEALVSSFFNRSLENSEQSNIAGSLSLDDDDIDAKLQKMLDEANNLYKNGELDKAQKMYDEISEINKRRQEIKGETPEEDKGFAYQLAA